MITTNEELALKLTDARKQVPPATMWRHYKGESAGVLALLVREQDLAVLVAYVHDEFLWCRPLEEWLGEVTDASGNRVKRFTRVEG